MCLYNKIIPKFLNFRVSNLHLKASHTYHVCQIKLVKEGISMKKSKVKTLEKDFFMFCHDFVMLRETLRIIDYTHIRCLCF